MLTPRQQQILAFLRRHQAERGAPPTRAELMAAFGFRSPTAAEDHLRALARKGAIELRAGTARGIRLLEPEEPAEGLPLIGRVAAGRPLLDEALIERRIAVDPATFRPRADFFLSVRGESMRDAGILDGDWLAVARTETAENGWIVVARVDEAVTVKRFQRRGERVRLLAANPAFAPIEIDLARQSLRIEGRAVGLIRPGGFAE
ncbi:MAG TPA: transcriptional repressor LexA [Nevskiaceae bacterium]|nr:transcriptional repressor LexA [Nevskiaceae bacterium]